MIIPKKRPKTFLLLSTVLIASIAGFGVFIYFNNTDGSSHISKDGINYSPATKEDAVLNDSIKQNLSTDDGLGNQESTDKPPSANNEKVVTPVISAWGQPSGPGTDLKVNGYVPDIIEENGTCTLTMTKDGSRATTTKASLLNAQNTSCGQMVIGFNKLSPGIWSAVLSYKSPYSAGSSKIIMLEVK